MKVAQAGNAPMSRQLGSKQFLRLEQQGVQFGRGHADGIGERGRLHGIILPRVWCGFEGSRRFELRFRLGDGVAIC